MNGNTARVMTATMTEDSTPLLPINAVERETGVSKELLRMWERRYEFPKPLRDAQGDRIYPADQVNKLRLLRRLIEYGFRPGKIIELDVPELEKLLKTHGRSSLECSPELEAELLAVLKSRDAHRLREYLSHQLVKQGLQTFVLDFLQYTNFIVGDAWMRGLVEVYEEHLYTEQVQSLIRQAISSLREATVRPRIMLTTAPEEQHTLGILMVEALLRLENIDAVSYGAQMPTRDIAQAVARHKMDVVALSFSASFPTTRAVDFLEDLRFKLPLDVEIWAGGSSLSSTRRHVEGVEMINDLAAIRRATGQWTLRRGIKA
jgi:DNA-binding transcriptional MerR regulator